MQRNNGKIGQLKIIIITISFVPSLPFYFFLGTRRILRLQELFICSALFLDILFNGTRRNKH